MKPSESTCWTVLREAAAGDRPSREAFALRYEPSVRTYLAARWKGSALIQEIDDAVQEAFVECLRDGGGLDRLQPGRPGGFRAFLYGLIRNVALRVEQRWGRVRQRIEPGPIEAEALPAREEALSRVFDRAWAKSIMRQAADRQAERASRAGDAAVRRVELLRLRFQEGQPIRDIARAWGDDPAVLHREYAKGREEFKAALLEVLAFHHPDSPVEVGREAADLLGLLG
ncbi:MAG: sigma-70 family RNA polymerase sigma factor [Isosphaeraceae bacterium]